MNGLQPAATQFQPPTEGRTASESSKADWPSVIPAELFRISGIAFILFVIINLLCFILRALSVTGAVLCTAVSIYLRLKRSNHRFTLYECSDWPVGGLVYYNASG
jgi:hypothetical protein